MSESNSMEAAERDFDFLHVHPDSRSLGSSELCCECRKSVTRQHTPDETLPAQTFCSPVTKCAVYLPLFLLVRAFTSSCVLRILFFFSLNAFLIYALPGTAFQRRFGARLMNSYLPVSSRNLGFSSSPVLRPDLALASPSTTWLILAATIVRWMSLSL